MCRDNCIMTSWSWVSIFIVVPFVIGAFVATSLGIQLTWGEVTIIPFFLTFFLNKKRSYCFTDSGVTVQWIFRKRTVSTETIKQIDVFGTKSGTWIVIELNGAPTISSRASRIEILSYYLRNFRKSFLIQLQWGERDTALEILRRCFTHKAISII